jgi:hypothetical protein
MHILETYDLIDFLFQGMIKYFLQINSEILPRLFTKFATNSDMAGGTAWDCLSQKVLLNPMVVGCGLQIIIMEKRQELRLASHFH